MPDSPLKVLLVEDNPDHADLIRLHLSRGSNGAAEVQWVERLSEGLERIDAGGVDAVLLDMMLPDCTGIDTVRRMHAHAPDLPVVVLTSTEGEEHGLEAMHEGAEDYIFKGRMDGQSLIRALRYAVERSARRLAEGELEVARQEVRIAQRIQQSLYPVQAPPAQGLQIAGVSHPAESVGGDYFDYIPLPDHHLAIAIGDVSGHGIGPALIMAETRAALRTLARTCREVGQILTLANHILMDGMLEGQFITLMLTSIDLKKRTLTYASAGHPPGLIFQPDGQLARQLDSTGFPLGVMPDEQYQAPEAVLLEPGQQLLLFTDGIIEASPPGEMQPFGMDRLLALMCEHRNAPAPQILAQIEQEVRAHCKPGAPLDDVTAVLIKVQR